MVQRTIGTCGVCKCCCSAPVHRGKHGRVIPSTRAAFTHASRMGTVSGNGAMQQMAAPRAARASKLYAWRRRGLHAPRCLHDAHACVSACRGRAGALFPSAKAPAVVALLQCSESVVRLTRCCAAAPPCRRSGSLLRALAHEEIDQRRACRRGPGRRELGWRLREAPALAPLHHGESERQERNWVIRELVGSEEERGVGLLLPGPHSLGQGEQCEVRVVPVADGECA